MLNKLNFSPWAVLDKVQLEAVLQKTAIFIMAYHLVSSKIKKGTRGGIGVFPWSIQEFVKQEIEC